MPYKDPAIRKVYNRRYGAAWSRRNRDRKNAAYARYVAVPANREKVRRVAQDAYYRRLYNITKAQFDVMARRQLGKCLICRKKKPLVMDHCHDTGKIRGLLCSTCNRLLGLYESWKKSKRFDGYLEVYGA